jgi:Nuclease subunit of the excinuclease complex
MTRSTLDDVPGLGPTRRKRLLKEFGSVKRLRTLTEEELVAIPWLPARVANALYAHLHGPALGQRTSVEISKTPAGVSTWRGDNGAITSDDNTEEA